MVSLGTLWCASAAVPASTGFCSRECSFQTMAHFQPSALASSPTSLQNSWKHHQLNAQLVLSWSRIAPAKLNQEFGTVLPFRDDYSADLQQLPNSIFFEKGEDRATTHFALCPSRLPLQEHIYMQSLNSDAHTCMHLFSLLF